MIGILCLVTGQLTQHNPCQKMLVMLSHLFKSLWSFCHSSLPLPHSFSQLSLTDRFGQQLINNQSQTALLELKLMIQSRPL